MCGGLNINLFRALLKDMQQWKARGVEIEFALIGNKAASFFRSYGGQVSAMLTNIGDRPAIDSLIGGIRVMLDAYSAGRIDRLFIASNKFVNTMSQQPGHPHSCCRWKRPATTGVKHRWDYLYEPDATRADRRPRDPVHRIAGLSSVIENQACEQAAKMVAMKNATENAAQMIDDLHAAL